MKCGLKYIKITALKNILEYWDAIELAHGNFLIVFLFHINYLYEVAVS